MVSVQVTSPLPTEATICEVSLNGTCSICVPVRISSSALPRCDGLPTNGVAYEILPGLAFAAAISSPTVLYGPAVETAIRKSVR